MSDVPMVTMWMGKRLEDMTRDELIEALKTLGGQHHALLENTRMQSLLMHRLRSARDLARRCMSSDTGE